MDFPPNIPKWMPGGWGDAFNQTSQTPWIKGCQGAEVALPTRQTPLTYTPAGSWTGAGVKVAGIGGKKSQRHRFLHFLPGSRARITLGWRVTSVCLLLHPAFLGRKVTGEAGVPTLAGGRQDSPEGTVFLRWEKLRRHCRIPRAFWLE